MALLDFFFPFNWIIFAINALITLCAIWKPCKFDRSRSNGAVNIVNLFLNESVFRIDQNHGGQYLPHINISPLASGLADPHTKLGSFSFGIAYVLGKMVHFFQDNQFYVFASSPLLLFLSPRALLCSLFYGQIFAILGFYIGALIGLFCWTGHHKVLGSIFGTFIGPIVAVYLVHWRIAMFPKQAWNAGILDFLLIGALLAGFASSIAIFAYDWFLLAPPATARTQNGGGQKRNWNNANGNIARPPPLMQFEDHPAVAPSSYYRNIPHSPPPYSASSSSSARRVPSSLISNPSF